MKRNFKEQATELLELILRVHPNDVALVSRAHELVESLGKKGKKNVVDIGSDSSPRRNRKKQDTGDGD